MLTRGIATLNKTNDPPILHPAHVHVLMEAAQVGSLFDTDASSNFANKKVAQTND